MMDSIKAKIPERTDRRTVESARARFKSRTPQVRIGKVTVSGGKAVENAYLQSFFGHRHEGDSTLGLRQGRDAYYRAATATGIQNFVPTPRFNVRDSLVNLDFKAVIKIRSPWEWAATYHHRQTVCSSSMPATTALASRL